jgi:hypothetical protein
MALPGTRNLPLPLLHVHAEYPYRKLLDCIDQLIHERKLLPALYSPGGPGEQDDDLFAATLSQVVPVAGVGPEGEVRRRNRGV